MASHEQEDLAPPDIVLLHQEGLRSNPLPSVQSSSSPASSVNASSPSIINIAYINCVGQTKLTLSKQLEIQSYMKSHRVDILHLQECMIDNDSFGDCNYVRSNFNIFSNNTPNNTYYGTASLCSWCCPNYSISILGSAEWVVINMWYDSQLSYACWTVGWLTILRISDMTLNSLVGWFTAAFVKYIWLAVNHK